MEILSMIVLGFAIFAIIFTIIATLLNFLIKVKQPNAIKTLLVKYPLIFIYVAMICFAIFVLNKEDEQIEGDNSIDVINEKISAILAEHRSELSIYVVEMLEDVAFIAEKRPKKHEEYIIGTIETELVKDEFVKEFRQNYKVHDMVLSDENCSTEFYTEEKILQQKWENLTVGVKELKKSIDAKMKNYEVLKNVFKGIRDELAEKVKKDVLTREARKYLDAMEDMVKHYEPDADRSSFQKQECYDKTKELSPTFTTQIIVKILVSATTLAIYFLLPISIFAAVHHTFLGSKGFTKAILISLYLNALLTLSICLVTVLLATGTIGRFDCLSEVGKLGAWRFSTPFPFGDKYLPICARPDTKFFSVLGTNMPTSEEVLEIYDFGKYKKLLKTPSIAMNITNITINIDELMKTFNSFKKSVETLKIYQTKECIVETQFLHIPVLQLDKWREIIEKFNTGLTNIVHNVDSNYQAFLEDQRKIITEEITGFFLIIDNIDFSCEPITKLYSNFGAAVCELFDVPLDVYWIYLIVTILVCMINSLLLIALYRSYKSAADDINQNHINSKTK